MLRAASRLYFAKINAVDGEVGAVDELLFDDLLWTVRYLVVDTGDHLFHSKAPISPIALGSHDWQNNRLNVDLTREHINNSPRVGTDRPLSREWEKSYYSYYGWPNYWSGMGAWGAFWYPTALRANQVQGSNGATPKQKTGERTASCESAQIRSMRQMLGYSVVASDGHVGHIDDFIVGDDSWRIKYVAVYMRNQVPGMRVLLPPDWICKVNWGVGKVTINVTHQKLRNSPGWEQGQPISHDFEDRLYRFCAKRPPTDRKRQATSADNEFPRPRPVKMKRFETEQNSTGTEGKLPAPPLQEQMEDNSL